MQGEGCRAVLLIPVLQWLASYWEHGVLGYVGEGGERQQFTSPSRYTLPYSRLYRGMSSRAGGDRNGAEGADKSVSCAPSSSYLVTQCLALRVQGPGCRV